MNRLAGVRERDRRGRHRHDRADALGHVVRERDQRQAPNRVRALVALWLIALAPSSPASDGTGIGNGKPMHDLVLRGGLLVDGTGNPSYLGTQGWYDNAIWVDPSNPATLVVGGGPDAWRSTDSGVTLTRISQWQSAPSSAQRLPPTAIR